MKLIYTLKFKDLPEGYAARNPRYFVAVERGVEIVRIDGKYPAIVRAYLDAGIKVDLAEVAGKGEGEVTEPISLDESLDSEEEPKPFADMTVPELKQHLTEQGIEFDSKANKAQLLALIQE